MKTIYTYLKRVVLAGCMLAGAAAPTFAQWDSSKAHLIVDWQMNAPFSTGYADKISGWGMNFEGLYDVTPRWSVGAFVMYHTNHRYIGRQTLQLSPTESLTTDQQRSAFQLPFGVSTAYTLCQGNLSVRISVRKPELCLPVTPLTFLPQVCMTKRGDSTCHPKSACGSIRFPANASGSMWPAITAMVPSTRKP